MRDSNVENSPDLYSQILSRASRNITSFACEIQNHPSNHDLMISDRKHEMLNIVESTAHSEEIQLKEISKFRDWLDSLDRDQQLFDDISTGTNFPVDSPYADIDRLVKEDRKRRESQSQSKNNSFEIINYLINNEKFV